MRRCSVANCRVVSGKSTGVSNFQLPKHNLKQRRAWIKFCKRKDDISKSHRPSICSVHFDESSFERDFRNELLGLPLRKLLKKDALPTLHPPIPSSTNTLQKPEQQELRRKRNEIRCRRKLATDLLASNSQPAVEKSHKEEQDRQGVSNCVYKSEFGKIIKGKYEELKQSTITVDMKVLKKSIAPTGPSRAKETLQSLEQQELKAKQNTEKSPISAINPSRSNNASQNLKQQESITKQNAVKDSVAAICPSQPKDTSPNLKQQASRTRESTAKPKKRPPIVLLASKSQSVRKKSKVSQQADHNMCKCEEQAKKIKELTEDIAHLQKVNLALQSQIRTMKLNERSYINQSVELRLKGIDLRKRGKLFRPTSDGDDHVNLLRGLPRRRRASTSDLTLCRPSISQNKPGNIPKVAESKSSEIPSVPNEGFGSRLTTFFFKQPISSMKPCSPACSPICGTDSSDSDVPLSAASKPMNRACSQRNFLKDLNHLAPSSL